MLNNFWSSPLFWISVYLIGYIIVMVMFVSPRVLSKVENKMPKPLIRIFALLTFGVPVIALPFNEGPKIAIPTSVALTVGITTLGINFIIKILAQRQIGMSPALKSKMRLVTKGLYGIVRHNICSFIFLALFSFFFTYYTF